MSESEVYELVFSIPWGYGGVDVRVVVLAADSAAAEPDEVPVVSVGTDVGVGG